MVHASVTLALPNRPGERSKIYRSSRTQGRRLAAILSMLVLKSVGSFDDGGSRVRNKNFGKAGFRSLLAHLLSSAKKSSRRNKRWTLLSRNGWRDDPPFSSSSAQQQQGTAQTSAATPACPPHASPNCYQFHTPTQPPPRQPRP